MNSKELLKKEQQLLISSKPPNLNKPIKDEKQCISEINKYYKSIDELKDYGLKKEDALHLSLLPNKERYDKCYNFITKVLLD